MTPEEKCQRIKAMAEELHEMFPDGKQVVLSWMEWDVPAIDIHRVSDYDTGTHVLRSLGIGEREKRVFVEPTPWSTLSGKTANGITATAFLDELPPSCHVEEKQVEVDEMIPTGKKVMETRHVVVCTEAAEGVAK